MIKATSISLMINLLTLILLLVSCPYTVVAPSGGSMGGGGFSDDAISGSSFSSTERGVWSSTARPYQPTFHRDEEDGYVFDDDFRFESGNVINFSVLIIAVVLVFVHCHCYDGRNSSLERLQQTSVIKLQVALNGTARSFQKDLNLVAQKADTSKQSGYKYILKESSKALLRHSDFWLSSYLTIETVSSINQAKDLFNQLSFAERLKFDQETLINIDNYRQESVTPGATTSENSFILVTFLVATTELLQLHSVNTTKDLRAVVQKLGAVSRSGIEAAHVLWTPQEENDYLTQKRFLQDYPLLRQLNKEVELNIY